MSKKTKIIIVVVALILIIGIAYFIFRKKPSTSQIPTQIAPDAFSGGSGYIAPPQDQFPLKPGSKGENVRRLQTALNRIQQTSKINVDGIYGNSTKVKLVTTVATNFYGVGGTVDENQLNYLIQLGNNA